MKIAIIGAGMTGAYLYKLLVAKGHSVDIFDRYPGTRCGLTPCAWEPVGRRNTAAPPHRDGAVGRQGSRSRYFARSR